MKQITQPSVQRVRQGAPICSVLAPMGTIKRAGSKNTMRCIAHDDKHPSLQIDPVRNTCKCWSCGWSGDVITAYMKVQEVNNQPVDFPEAVRALAAQYNIPIEETDCDPNYKEAAAAAKKRSDHAYSLHQYVADYYHDHLHKEIGQGTAKTTPYAYFTQRGLTQATIDTFHLGGVPHTSQAFVDTLIGQGYTTDDISQYELFRQDRNHDWQSTIHDRVVYPIQNHMGKFVAFAGRRLPDPQNPEADKIRKYLNSSASDIYHKHELLYGLFQAKKTIGKQDHCYIVEGYQDVLAMHQAGITETIALCGVALSEQQCRNLQRFTDQITLMLDGDKAGQKAMLAHLEVLLQTGCYVSLIILPQGQDPDDYLHTYLQAHPDATRDDILTSFSNYTQDWLTHCCQLLAPLQGKTLRQAQDKLFALLSVIPDKVRQEQAIKQAARLLDIDYNTVTYEVKKALERNRTSTTPSLRATSPLFGEELSSTQNTHHSKTHENTLHSKAAENTLHRKKAENTLDSKVAENTLHRKVAENTLDSKVAENTLHRKVAENTLDSKVAENTLDSSSPKSGEVPRRGGVVDSKQTTLDPKQATHDSKKAIKNKVVIENKTSTTPSLRPTSPRFGEELSSTLKTKQHQTETTILRHLVLYGTYRITPDDPTTAIAHWIYQDLQQEGITLKNPILQQLLEATHQAHTEWLTTLVPQADAPQDICYQPYTLVAYLQTHPDPKICECATRIYNQQISQEFTYGDNAHPTVPEVIENMESQVLHLKIGIIETQIKNLSQSICDALGQDDIGKYKELNQEKTRWTEMLRVAWGKMRE